MAPIDLAQGEQYEHLWAKLKATGYLRVRIDGTTHEIDAVPQLDRGRERAFLLVGEPRDAAHRAAGCSFHPRCPVGPEVLEGRTRCIDEVPELLGDPHPVACHFPLSAE
jgi:hypothetical protein